MKLIHSLLKSGSKRSFLAKKNILYALIFNGLSVLTGLMMVPLLLDYLDAERYGIWITLTSIVGWFTFFDAGLANGLRNKLTQALAVGNMVLAREYISTTYAILTITFGVVLLLFYFINPFVPWNVVLNTTFVPSKELSLLSLIVFTFFFLRFVLNIIGIVLISDQRPAWNTAFGPITNVIGLTIIFLLTKVTSGDLVLLGLVLSGTPLIVLLGATIVLFDGRYNALKPSLTCINWGHYKLLMGLSLKFFIIQVAGLIMFSTSNLIITQVLGPHDVAVYNTAFKYFQIPIMLYGTVMTPIWSAATDAYAKNDFLWLNHTLRRLNKLSLYFAVGLVIMLIFSPFVYKIWVGDGLHIPFSVSLALMFFALINIILTPYSHLLSGMSKIYLASRIVWVSIFVYFPLALFLAKTSLQLSGIILATCIVNFLGMPFQIIQTNKILNGSAYGIWNK